MSAICRSPLLGLAGWPDAEPRAKQVIQLETKIATVSWTKAQDRDLNASYNPMSIRELLGHRALAVCDRRCRSDLLMILVSRKTKSFVRRLPAETSRSVAQNSRRTAAIQFVVAIFLGQFNSTPLPAGSLKNNCCSPVSGTSSMVYATLCFCNLSFAARTSVQVKAT